jgi:hypothetical protein
MPGLEMERQHEAECDDDGERQSARPLPIGDRSAIARCSPVYR